MLSFPGVISVSVAGQRQQHQQPGSQQQLFNKPAVPPGAQAVSSRQAVTVGHQRVPAAAAVPAAEEIPDSTTSGVSNVISIPDTEPLAGNNVLTILHQLQQKTLLLKKISCSLFYAFLHG